MKCTSYCTADSYDTVGLIKYLQEHNYKPTLYDDVIHVKIDNKGIDNQAIDIFILPIGCIIFWGGGNEVREEIIRLVKSYEVNSLPLYALDKTAYEYNDSEETHINEEEDKVILESDDVLIKLSMTHAFAQSVKLIHFEGSVMQTIKKSRHLTDELAIQGKTSLSRKQLAKKIGAMFAERNAINLHSDSLDTPEFFWRKPRYEPYYQMAAAYMDITTRLQILNRRLDVIHDVYTILADELKYLHTSRLEWIVIFLIGTEVVFSLMNHLT
jgi:uncharacterized Rmd1/YagE family protein